MAVGRVERHRHQDGKPIGNAAPYVVRTFGALTVGFIGLCLTTSEITPDKLTHTRLVEPLEAAAQYLPRLKQEGATVIVAVTHLAFATDRHSSNGSRRST